MIYVYIDVIQRATSSVRRGSREMVEKHAGHGPSEVSITHVETAYAVQFTVDLTVTINRSSSSSRDIPVLAELAMSTHAPHGKNPAIR